MHSACPGAHPPETPERGRRATVGAKDLLIDKGTHVSRFALNALTAAQRD